MQLTDYLEPSAPWAGSPGWMSQNGAPPPSWALVGDQGKNTTLEEHGAGPGGHTHRVPPAQRWESQRRALWGVGG